ncbi:MAG: polymerase, sigma-24 subunit, subfamily [Paenibacillaceae bacterium]|nr:polymerase, sigma-24 subunit, subfamily [Paenibacillaceae bacterium]
MTSAEAKSIEEICTATWESLYRFVYFKVQNRQEAEDTTQETYVKAYSHLQSGKVAPDKYIAFLKTIALNLIRDSWRRKKRRGPSIDVESVDPAHFAVEDHTEESAQRQAVQEALAQLNEDQRTVIELRILKGYSVADTAKLMGKQEVAIRVIQHRALKQMASLLNPIRE